MLSGAPPQKVLQRGRNAPLQRSEGSPRTPRSESHINHPTSNLRFDAGGRRERDSYLGQRHRRMHARVCIAGSRAAEEARRGVELTHGRHPALKRSVCQGHAAFGPHVLRPHVRDTHPFHGATIFDSGALKLADNPPALADPDPWIFCCYGVHL